MESAALDYTFVNQLRRNVIVVAAAIAELAAIPLIIATKRWQLSKDLISLRE